MPLTLRERVAVGALQERGHRLVERVLVVGRRERPRDRPPFRIADVLGDLVAQRALAEPRETLPQVHDAASGAGVLGSEGVDVAEQVLVDERREAVQLEQRVLQRRRRQQQLAATQLPEIVDIGATNLSADSPFGCQRQKVSQASGADEELGFRNSVVLMRLHSSNFIYH